MENISAEAANPRAASQRLLLISAKVDLWFSGGTSAPAESALARALKQESSVDDLSGWSKSKKVALTQMKLSGTGDLAYTVK